MSNKMHYLQDNLPAQMLHVLFFCGSVPLEIILQKDLLDCPVHYQ